MKTPSPVSELSLSPAISGQTKALRKRESPKNENEPIRNEGKEKYEQWW